MSDSGSSPAFKALLVEEVVKGKFEQRVVDRSLADLPEGDLLVDVHYSSLNYKDALSAHGNRDVTRNYPHVPGIDAAGVVLGDSSGKFQPGDKVLVCGYDLGMNTFGALSQKIRVSSGWASLCPEGLTLREAMIYGTAGFTAALCIEKLERMGASPDHGDVAVTGATGGVGCFAIAMLHKLGYDVAAFTGKLEASEFLAGLGAKQVIDRDTLNEISKRPMGKPQWAYGVDAVGGDFLFNLIKSIKPEGAVAACGLAASATFDANVFPFILRGVSLLGVDSVELPIEKKAQVWESLGGRFKLPNLETMAEEISLEQAPEYLTRLYNGHAIGRYVVNVKG